MKRAMAVGATLATTAATTLVAASGASAAPALVPAPECETLSESLAAITNMTAASNWYGTCTPQYGLGKVEFSISSATDFPDGFKPLNDPKVHKTINQNSSDVATYLDGILTEYGVNALTRVDDGSNPKKQRYRIGNGIGTCGVELSVCSVIPSAVRPSSTTIGGALPVHINSVAKINPSSLPESICGDSSNYRRAYSVNFDPVVMTFTQTVTGELWRFDVNIAPDEMYLGFTPDFAHHTLVAGAPFCKVQGDFNAHVDDLAVGSVIGSSAISPAAPVTISDFWTALFSFTMQNPYQADYTESYVGNFARYVPPPAPKPVLPDTGQPNESVSLIAGSGMLLAGLIAWGVSRRRNRNPRSPRA